ncbi:serine hydrolase [Paraburkholderia sp. RL18-085-BIA-A]
MHLSHPQRAPLKVPDNIHDEDQLLAYFEAWRAAYRPGTYRTYSNPDIGTFGAITAQSTGRSFTALMEERLFSAFGTKNTYLEVPATKMPDYAQDYADEPSACRRRGSLTRRA